MRNKIIEDTIERVVAQSQISPDAKSVLAQYIKNKFDNNAGDIDLKQALDLIEVDEEEEYYENVNS